jgi:hypothetical protein
VVRRLFGRLGIQHAPSFGGERFLRSLKDQCLWLHRFTDLAHVEREIGAFMQRYNRWLLERHDHCTPRAIRAKLRATA